ncbi:MAG: hypothetical protein MSA65_03590 [Mollicutes bacterium]|nr:hypothetical protein [Mollicutes bacterium]
MNYINSNFYPNYQYGNNQFLPNNQQSMYSLPQQNTPSLLNNQPQMNILNGKIVDSIDMVKATEVPIGGYGIFPKADLKEIYIKTWNADGTTNVITFQPYTPPEQPSEEKSNSINQIDMSPILEKISLLDSKIDSILQQEQKIMSPPQNNNAQVTETKNNIEKRKVNINGY